MADETRIILIISLIASVVSGCDNIPLYETDSYGNLIGTWNINDNTHDDAPWPDSKFVFTTDGYLKVYHLHDSTEYLAGTFMMDSISETQFTAIFHLAGDCNVSYDGSDWQGNGAILYCWYDYSGTDNLKIGFPGSEWNIDPTKYISFVR